MTSLFPSPHPPLPDFSTLLIAGPYHASAPIHLALSSNLNTPRSRTILFAPSRSTLKQDLQRFNDSWLTARSGNGATSELASNVIVL
ncbi:hypothetical protein GALMADRAFT_55637 [Galerina marginata CBS 339.88]|uniref:DEAD/DEAH box helicase domain-containing protein n=1 Tax=Galerina marginata (strain CBS 339.88) TaxID=685588 RepID=A0A067TTU9_GALM3|nr:hypothetical protein GALMADRAFT_55637 [Galerina marginata CBS 339.88]